MVNSNPETVSTDYDTSDRLYLEPLVEQNVLDVCELEQPVGVAVSYGGQTPLRLAPALAAAGVPLLGDPLDAIDAAEDRGRFARIAGDLAPEWGTAANADEAREVAERIGYPVLVRPHHVLGGRGMHVARSADELRVDGPVPRRPLPRGRARARRRRALRRRGRVGRGGARARRAGGRALGRLGVRAAGAVGDARRSRREIRDAATLIARGTGARGLLNLQLAVARRAALRARGEPARVADGAVRREGDRRAARRALGAAAARRAARRARPARARVPDARLGEGGRLPVGALPGRGVARARDALDRRGDGAAPTAVEAYRRALRAAGARAAAAA